MTRRSRYRTQLGGYRIPRGTWLYIFPYVVHRDSRWFDEPAAFVPDRFLSDAFGPLQRAAYIPLGLGPHVCIGKALSTIVLTSILACILRDFRLGLPPGDSNVQPAVNMVMTPSAETCLITQQLGEEEPADTD
jgi:cytochrome P450